MTDPEIISIYLLIECKGKSINSGYSILKSDFPNLVKYLERSRFNRLVNSLMSVIRAIRRELSKTNNSKYKIVDSFPLIKIKPTETQSKIKFKFKLSNKQILFSNGKYFYSHPKYTIK